MSIEGDNVASTRPVFVAACAQCAHENVALELVAMTEPLDRQPHFFAIQPARISPKLPVGTTKDTGRCGAPSATALVK